MTLDDYISENNISITDFAKELGVHRVTLYRWLAKESYPRHAVAKKIIELTQEQVTYKDLFE